MKSLEAHHAELCQIDGEKRSGAAVLCSSQSSGS